ncbi:MAG: NAD(P)H-hydrate dehydratase [Bacteroidales bacterium]|nr:NAD(P)H-hydrate dehydratase [Bacteroidales bacterium]
MPLFFLFLAKILTFARMTPHSTLEITSELSASFLRSRPFDGHKGTFGHLLLVAGRYGMMGAAVLAARSAMRSGIGKLTVHLTERTSAILQLSIPEALLHFEENSNIMWASPILLNDYQSVLIGPGIGQSGETQWALRTQLKLLAEQQAMQRSLGLVLDADALNLIAQDYQMLSLVPQGTILTPHLGEMSRLARALELPYESEEDLREAAQCVAKELHLNVVLKSHETMIYTPEGAAYCNTKQGNHGMATAGSGDVLAGIIGALLAQGYSPSEATVLGVYLHATAGDFAAKEKGTHSMIASDIVEYLPKSFLSISTSSLEQL